MNVDDAYVGMRVVCTVPGAVVEKGWEGEVTFISPTALSVRWDVRFSGGLTCWFNPQSVEPAAAERGTPWGDFVHARNALIKHLHAQGLSFGSISLEVSTDMNAVARIVKGERNERR